MSQFDSSTFTAADGTELSASDANWTKLDAAADNAVITGNRLRRVTPSGSATARYRRTTAAPSADYSVACDLYIVGTTSTAFNGGPMARCVAGELTGYWTRWRNGTGIQLFRYNAGAATQLGSTVTQSQSVGSTLRLTLRCEGSVISVYRNAETTPIISVTDGSPITAAGHPGILTATDSTTDGPHLDNWSADTLETGTTINCNQGSASAVGYAASILAATTIACSLGSAAATGYQATVTVGSNTTINCALGTASASGNQATVTVSGSATITSDVFKNNTGTVLASTSIPKVAAVKLSDMTLAASWTSQTTDGSGVLTVSSGSLTTATDYLLVVSNADGSAVGVKKYTAV